MGKSKKKPHKPKSEDTNQEKLYLLHMDLCGPMCVASVNGKKYILVIVDDYSRFTWVKCLRSKDEAPDFIIKLASSHETFDDSLATANGVIVKNVIVPIEAARTMLIYTKALLFLWAEAIATASVQTPLHELTPVIISSRLVPKPPASTSFIPPTRTDWDLLFQPLFDELLTPPPSVDLPAPEVIALITEVVTPEPAVISRKHFYFTIDKKNR
ncbi:retrovirus-related pol polyprotein from transposon TNT 1-94 [Tanacetum coccineum]